MTIEEISELIQMVISTGVAELELQRGENRVWIKRSSGVVTQEIHIAAERAPLPRRPQPPRPPHRPQHPPRAPGGADPDLTDPTLDLREVAHRRDFLRIAVARLGALRESRRYGEPGQVLCIIESMKLMNEIEASRRDDRQASWSRTAQPVEYGEALFAIKPH